jgi:hypothetical protein
MARALPWLVEQGVLALHERLTSWDPCAGCECGLAERPIRWTGGRPFAACPLDADSDTALEPSVLAVYRLAPARLAALVARAAGTPGHPEEVVPALWRLGRLAGGRVLVLAMSSAAVRHPGAFDRLRAIDGAARITLVAAIASASEGAALRERGVDVVAPDDAFLPGEPAQPIRLDHDRLLGATSADPDLLEVHPMAVSAAFGGRPLPLEPRDFRVLAVLAREADDGGAAATRDDLYRALVDDDSADAPIGDEQVDKSVTRIRAVLCEVAGCPRDHGRRLIAARRGHGYILDTSIVRVRIR